MDIGHTNDPNEVIIPKIDDNALVNDDTTGEDKDTSNVAYQFDDSEVQNIEKNSGEGM